MMANKRDEAAGFKCARFIRVSVPLEVEQFLILCVSNRQNQAATFGELRPKRFGHRRRCGGNEDCIERSKVR